MKIRTRSLALGALLTFVVPAFAQTPPPAQKTQDPPKHEEAKKDAPKEEKGPYKKYSEVITDKAVSQDGLFKVHRIEDKVYFEIPESMLDKDLLWQTEMAELPSNMSYPGEGAGTRVVCFSRRNAKMYLRGCDYSIRSVGDDATTLGVRKSTVQPILMAWDVQTEGKIGSDKTAVIDVTSLFTSDPPDFAVRGLVGGAGVDGGRSFIQKVKAFPTNIETRSLLTFTTGGRPGMPSGTGASANTALVHYSLVKLPDEPMMGRLKDSRIGFFTQGFSEYGRPDLNMAQREYIDRFRLEKKDPGAAVSEPKHPIVFYVSREVPAKWRDDIKRGIEAWKPAFEQAGFKNAIIAKDAPSLSEDPDWDPEDARYSVVRWVPSPTQNAMGPSIQDPRSGETISAHLIIWSDITKLLENWYFAQCAGIDPKARTLPMDAGLMNELVQYVTSHEVGHTLGLEHNMKGSAWYTAQQLRDPAFTNANGVSSSIMDYSRFNYVAQPGDGVTRTIGMIGPYDRFAIEYGYKPLPNAVSPDAEKPFLNQILTRQVSDPRLRFGNYRFSQDPTTQSEDIGSDAVAVGELGLKNIDNIATNYLWMTTTKYGEDYGRLSEMRSELLGQRMLEINHVMRMVGGVAEADYHVGQGGAVFVPVSKARQKAAVQFLSTHGLDVPNALYDQKLLSRIAPNGFVSQATAMPRMILTALLADSRIGRMTDNEVANPASAYTVASMVSDITDNVFHELATPTPTVSVYRRALQRTYLDTMDKKINATTKSDLRLVAKAELIDLAGKIALALPKTTDKMTRLHLMETRSDIKKVLENRYTTPGTAQPMSLADFMMGFGLVETAGSGENCWVHDLIDPDLRKQLEAERTATGK
jgi:hypothetical protein